jgi:hypothetical protein
MKHPRIHSFNPYAVLSFEDLLVFSNLLRAEFPEAVYFCGNYKSSNRLPPQYPSDKPIEFYPSLYDGTRHFGNWLKRPRIYFRVPWSEEIASYDPNELIGGRWEPVEGSDSVQWRKFGRCADVLFQAGEYEDARTYRTGRAGSPPLIEQRGTLPSAVYPQFFTLSGIGSRLHGAYDSNDAETTAFFKRVHALWRRLSTWETALYNPITGEISQEARGENYGKLALAAAIDGTKRYPGFGLARDGAALMLGPRPKKPKI